MAIQYLDAKRIRGSSTADPIPRQGYDGAAGATNIAGGGGGAGAAGSSKNGGNGKASSITGNSVTYAGGGGGSADGSNAGGSGGSGGGGNGGSNNQASVGGEDGKGGGCGGGGNVSGNDSTGGSGVVILRFTTSGTSYSQTGTYDTPDTSTVSGKTILRWTDSGTFVLSGGTPDVEYLVVAGGGGSMTNWGHSGGSGAGGMLEGTKSSMANATYTVTVGAGGVGSTNAPLQGGNSVFSDVTAIGGGYGGNWVSSSTRIGGAGGSGGGASSGNYAGGTGTASSSTDEKATLVTTTTYSSSMGTGADGTAISDPTFVAEGDTNGVAMPSGFGSGAKSMYFDGNDAININGAKDFSASSGTVGTISFWYYNTGTQEGKTILQFGDESASQYMTFETRESGNDCIVCHNQDGTGSSGNNWEIRNAAGDAGASLATSTWHHCVASQNGTAVVCYIDGEELTTWNNQNDKSEWILSGIDNVRIGCRNNNSGGEGGFITGNITEVALWNVALSEAQVDSLYGNGGSTAQKATTIPTGLRAYYDGSSLTNNLADYSDIPVGTRFEETDSRKIYRMKDGAWVLKGVTA